MSPTIDKHACPDESKRQEIFLHKEPGHTNDPHSFTRWDEARPIEVILAWRVRIGSKQGDQHARHRDEHHTLCLPHQGASEGVHIKAFGPREISDSQTKMAPAVGAQLHGGFLSSLAHAGTFCMRAHYL